jgi:DNA helicase-2/ATP-dependent DNA helicase PcrA
MKSFIEDNVELYNYAKSLSYSDFSKMYVDKDQLLDDKKQDEGNENKKGSKRDNLIKHLFKIQTNIYLYQNKRYNEFLRATDYRFRIVSIASKRVLKENIESLVNVGERTIEEVIIDANEKGICLIDDKLIDFKNKKEYLYNRVKDVKYSEFQKLYEYLEGKTPFSTQHKTKGAEFNNVLVILDNGGWNNYNFGNLFLQTGLQSVLVRTQKIFYVCCTRAKENLAVFYHNPDPQVIAKAKDWFGDCNVIGMNT